MSAPRQLVPVERGLQKADMLAMVQKLQARIEAGEILRFGVVFELTGGCWGSEFSRSDDSRVDSAMLIELGLRRLGFATRPGEPVQDQP